MYNRLCQHFQVCKGAKDLKLAVTGSQIVGVVPLKAILQVAEFYIHKESLFVLEEDQKIHLVGGIFHSQNFTLMLSF